MKPDSINVFMGQTPNASEHGGLVDHMLGFVHWFMLVLFIGWSAYLVIAFWRFRNTKSKQADYHGFRGHATTHIEIGVAIVEAILLLGFAFPLWARQADEYPTSPDTIRMRALGEKFLWNFQYPGADMMLSTWHLSYVDGATNTTGKDLHDPNGKDDFVNPGTMKLPVGRPVIVDVATKDVIHNLAIVSMRAAQDAIPGTKSHMWFKPTKTGTWDVICGQLCGPGHAQMKANIEVVEAKEYDDWAKEQSAAALKKITDAAAAPAAK
ncbi:MAG: cytochrome c oxidase subunit II [Prosthecobacter sp.]|uniref:cytochrome c oxidase subunit II n=1 Tax=Prosthecobacter sp. TaxID=1965333 RepID=UPI0038FD72A1